LMEAAFPMASLDEKDIRRIVPFLDIGDI